MENGDIVLNAPMKITSEMKESLDDVIELYETIRNIQKFDPNHCPIVEFQTDKYKNNYFLQYHRTRQMEHTTFILDRDLQEDEFEAVYVRGATPPEWLILDIAMLLSTISN